MEIKKEILADRIKQLIDVSQTLIENSEKLKQLQETYLQPIPNVIERHKFKVSEIPMMLRFLHCTFFYDALLNLTTLLKPVKENPDRKEISFFELIELEDDLNKKNTLLADVNSLNDKLVQSKLVLFRHKLVAHKDISNSGDPDIMYLNFIRKEFIDLTKNLLGNLDNLIQQNYDVPCTNSFKQLYQKSFNKLISMFEKELKK